MSGVAVNGEATRGSRTAPRSRRRRGAAVVLIAATLGLTPRTTSAQNILGIIDGLARFHGGYSFGRTHSHVHRSSHHRSAHDESANAHGSEGTGSSRVEGRGPDLTPAR
jgi:hypothetical protein